MYSPKKVISPRKPPLSPKGAGLKRSLPSKTLANYFKISAKRKGVDAEATSEEKTGGRYSFLIMNYLWRWKCCTVCSVHGAVWRKEQILSSILHGGFLKPAPGKC